MRKVALRTILLRSRNGSGYVSDLLVEQSLDVQDDLEADSQSSSTAKQ